MRIHNPWLPFLVFSMLAMVHLCCCRHVSWAVNEETKLPIKTKSPLPLSHRFLAISRYLELAATKVKPIHDLSHKAVPAGPNPLHN
ncbi:hypothetical protein Pint_17424 [Pistacia integerrima]|uniref:Uncharacterized protein n=1 Tax=Pistacia integerrima TaxID=434235 RepID=A0ACC0YUT3_9ROSI|nr:hypothetical protein Pint_17424 [Pistacia integerrima]